MINLEVSLSIINFQQMKILVTDDEALARKRIMKLLKEYDPGFEIIEATSGKECIDAIINEKPDLLFLDIQMTDMSGFEVIEKTRHSYLPVTIFVTAFDHFAVKAFEVRALDFLLKPYKSERFFEALERGLEKLRTDSRDLYDSKMKKFVEFLKNEEIDFHNQANSHLDKIVMKLGKKYYFIPTQTIKYIVSSAYYAEIFTQDGSRHLYRISMTELIEKLDPKAFIRVNRSTIINLKEIKEVISEGQGDYLVVMQDNKRFSLSKNYKKAFLTETDIK